MCLALGWEPVLEAWTVQSWVCDKVPLFSVPFCGAEGVDGREGEGI